MRINGIWRRTIWEEHGDVRIIDQRLLPHAFSIITLKNLDDACHAISDMAVRGAGLIGATAGYGMWLAAREAPSETFEASMEAAARALLATRPTASNLACAVNRQLAAMREAPDPDARRAAAFRVAGDIANEDALSCKRIGEHGLALLRSCHERKKAAGLADCTVHVLTHCNAGWLAFVDYGSALSPVYAAHDAGIPVHVWVDETRPRNQGASLTAYELGEHGVPHDLVADNAGGHLMQHGMVDIAIVGADRVTRCGDAANKIGTYLKALAAHDNGVPFYVALPSTTFDFSMRDGVREIPIEERGADEVRRIAGKNDRGAIEQVLICPETTPARNFGFDVTPSRLVTGFVTERGLCAASEAGILKLFPEAMREEPADGVVKFRAEHKSRPLDAVETGLAACLNNARRDLHQAGLIGVTEEGIGYGNISARLGADSFLVTGTATGRERELSPAFFTVVGQCIPEENTVCSEGPVKPSSESMTHAAVYAARSCLQSVIHIHCRPLFRALMESDVPRTPEGVPYGTPDMARAVGELAHALGDEGLFVTPGHEDGVLPTGNIPKRLRKGC